MYIWEMNYGSEESEPIWILCMDQARLNRIRHKCCFVHKFKNLMLLHASHHEVLIEETIWPAIFDLHLLIGAAQVIVIIIARLLFLRTENNR